MRLQREPTRRRDEIIEIARQCSTDRDDRKAYHQNLRAWYTRGTESEMRARFNKIKSHVRQSSAWLWGSESARFGITLPRKYGTTYLPHLQAAKVEFHRYWHDSRASLEIAKGVKWAHIYPTVIWKVVPSAGLALPTVVPDPGDVGVFESDKPFDRQEALIHFFPMTMPAFERLVKGHPREKDLLDLAYMEAELGAGADDPASATIERIAVANAMGGDIFNPGNTGGLTRRTATEPEAQVEAPRILMAEVWVVDDNIHDWRVVTCMAPNGHVRAVVWDRRTPVLSGMDPFVALTLDDALDYTWGFSETDDLSGLQEWREFKMDQIDQLFTLQLRPPAYFAGFSGMNDERNRRLRTPDGWIASNVPTAKVERLAPVMPPEAFAFIDGVDRMFAEQGGMSMLTSPQGGGDAGFQGGIQAGPMARLASARVKESASRVRYAASEVATLVLRLHRELSDEPLYLDNGGRFLMAQLPREIAAEVASHSSPIDAAEIQEKADRLIKIGAISKPTYVEMIDPPLASVLAHEARELEKAAAERSREILKIQEMKALKGRSR